MKYFLLFISFTCLKKVKNFHSENKILRIVKVDTVCNYYVFNTKDSLDSSIIVIGEKNKLDNCSPLTKRSIIVDSVKLTTKIKCGSGVTRIGGSGLVINGIRVTNEGGIIMMINNCYAFKE